jgi:Cellulose binding domain
MTKARGDVCARWLLPTALCVAVHAGIFGGCATGEELPPDLLAGRGGAGAMLGGSGGTGGRAYGTGGAATGGASGRKVSTGGADPGTGGGGGNDLPFEGGAGGSADASGGGGGEAGTGGAATGGSSGDGGGSGGISGSGGSGGSPGSGGSTTGCATASAGNGDLGKGWGLEYTNNDDDGTTDGRVRFFVQVTNRTTAAASLAAFKIRYYLSNEVPGPWDVQVLHAGLQGGMDLTNEVAGSWVSTSGTTGYLELSFSGGSLPAGKYLNAHVSFHATSYAGLFNECDDYSHGALTAYAAWANIAIFDGDNLLWGIPPP